MLAFFLTITHNHTHTMAHIEMLKKSIEERLADNKHYLTLTNVPIRGGVISKICIFHIDSYTADIDGKKTQEIMFDYELYVNDRSFCLCRQESIAELFNTLSKLYYHDGEFVTKSVYDAYIAFDIFNKSNPL